MSYDRCVAEYGCECNSTTRFVSICKRIKLGVDLERENYPTGAGGRVVACIGERIKLLEVLDR